MVRTNEKDKVVAYGRKDFHIIYLNAGTGNACAGQNRVWLSFLRTVNALIVSNVGNFGLALPTGSGTWIVVMEYHVSDMVFENVFFCNNK